MYESFSNEELVLMYQKEKNEIFKEKMIDEIVERNMGLVIKQLEKYHKENDPLYEDLVQLGKIAIVKAAKDFDESLGNKFSTYCTEIIKGEIKNFLRDVAWAIKVPREEKSIGWKLHYLEEEGKGKEEIMNELELDEEDFKYYKNLIIHFRPSTTFRNEDENDEESLLETTTASSIDVEYEVVKKDLLKSINKVLSEEERKLFYSLGEYNKNELSILFDKSREEIDKMIENIRDKISKIPGIEEIWNN